MFWQGSIEGKVWLPSEGTEENWRFSLGLELNSQLSFLFSFGVIPGSAQAHFLSLFSRVIPRNVWGPYMVVGIWTRIAADTLHASKCLSSYTISLGPVPNFDSSDWGCKSDFRNQYRLSHGVAQPHLLLPPCFFNQIKGPVLGSQAVCCIQCFLGLVAFVWGFSPFLPSISFSSFNDHSQLSAAKFIVCSDVSVGYLG